MAQYTPFAIVPLVQDTTHLVKGVSSRVVRASPASQLIVVPMEIQHQGVCGSLVQESKIPSRICLFSLGLHSVYSNDQRKDDSLCLDAPGGDDL